MSFTTAVVMVEDHLRLHVAQIEDKLHVQGDDVVRHGGGDGGPPPSARPADRGQAPPPG